MTLEPIDAAHAVELYLHDRETELTRATINSHRSRLSHFVRWCDDNGISNLNTLTGRQLHEYRQWRRADGGLSPASEKTQMDTIRVFIRWLESIDGVEQDLHTKVRSPTLSSDDKSRDVMLDSEQAEQVLSYLRKYEYASRQHVVLTLLWHTMMRVGAVHALDVDDFDETEQYLEVKHRPETGTSIKNANRGERLVALSPEVCTILSDWIADRRPAVTDEHGREPLVASEQGRVHRSTLRRDCYRFTRPCVFTDECPHDIEIADCDAADHDHSYDCPSSVSPHAFRRGGITHALNSEVPEKAISDRANVSESVLDAHYDNRSQHERMEQRRKYLDEL
jgi:site-specific recombinase XerD